MPDINETLRRHMRLLHKSERMKAVFKDLPIVSYRTDKNIADILVHGFLKRCFRITKVKCTSDCER
ncbi:hypothetical protein KP79_PYT26304 [Mizuhopecten yessoensis]|uniref:Uncharacterized protein n=1 Tax=Mizuhopecten yessoensis TaxID=6573 RepID=A0A210Q9L1_MIZYE|nr:hypothetical protein KP79_PYT26304 [Mizuhopecten yessoensis]